MRRRRRRRTEKSKQMTSLNRQSPYNEATGKDAKHKCISLIFEVLAAVTIKMFSTIWRHVVGKRCTNGSEEPVATPLDQRPARTGIGTSSNAARSSAYLRISVPSPLWTLDRPDGDTQHNTSVLLPDTKLLSAKNRGWTSSESRKCYTRTKKTGLYFLMMRPHRTRMTTLS